GDVDCGEILRRALMRQPDDAPAVGRDLHRHSLAHAAEAREHVVRQKLEIPHDGLVARRHRACVASGHSDSPVWVSMESVRRYALSGAARRRLSSALSMACFSGVKSWLTIRQMTAGSIRSYSCRSTFPTARISDQGCPGITASTRPSSLVAASDIRSRQRSAASWDLRS